MPEMQQPAQAAAPQEQGQEGKGGVAEFVVGLERGLSKLAALMQQSGVDKGAVQAMGQALELFRSAVTAISGGGAAPGGQEPADQGTTTMEQGNAKTEQAY